MKLFLTYYNFPAFSLTQSETFPLCSQPCGFSFFLSVFPFIPCNYRKSSLPQLLFQVIFSVHIWLFYSLPFYTNIYNTSTIVKILCIQCHSFASKALLVQKEASPNNHTHKHDDKPWQDLGVRPEVGRGISERWNSLSNTPGRLEFEEVKRKDICGWRQKTRKRFRARGSWMRGVMGRFTFWKGWLGESPSF